MSSLKLLVDYKWLNVKWYIMLDLWVHLLYYIVVCAEIYSNYLKPKGLKVYRIFVILYTLFLLTIEGYQGWNIGYYAFLRDIWNATDVLGQLFYLVFSIYDVLKQYKAIEFDIIWEQVAVFSMLLLLLRAVSLLRVNPNTRFLISMIKQVFRDMFSFLILQVIFVFIFSIIFLELGKVQ